MSGREGRREGYLACADAVVESDIPWHTPPPNYCIIVCCSCRESGIWSHCVNLKPPAVRVILALYVFIVLAKWGGPAFYYFFVKDLGSQI